MRVGGRADVRHRRAGAGRLSQILCGTDGHHAAVQYHQRTFAHVGPGCPPVRQHDERNDDPRHPADHHTFHFPDRHERARPAHRNGASLHLQHSGRGLHRVRNTRPQAQACTSRNAFVIRDNRSHHGQHDTHRHRLDRDRRTDDSPGQYRARAWRRARGRDGLEFARAAARRRDDHHAHAVCWPGDDRIHRDLLLRGFDDPDFRQSVLEPRDRPSRGKVAHADRLVHRRRTSTQLHHPGVVVEAVSLQADPQRRRCAGKADRRRARGRRRKEGGSQEGTRRIPAQERDFRSTAGRTPEQGDAGGRGRASAAPR